MVMPMPPQAWATLMSTGLTRGYIQTVLFARIPKAAVRTVSIIVVKPSCEWVVAKWDPLCLNLLTMMIMKPIAIMLRPIVCRIQCIVTLLRLGSFQETYASPETLKTASVIKRPTFAARDGKILIIIKSQYDLEMERLENALFNHYILIDHHYDDKKYL